MYTLNVSTDSRVAMIDITGEIKDVISKAGIQSGIVVVFVPHTTAGVTINEAADPSVVSDISMKLSKLIPVNENYRHAEGNSDAHIKTLLTGSSVQLIIENGSAVLGTWQGIFFCEYDGPRRRKVHIQVLGQ